MVSIVHDLSKPFHRLFILLPSGQRYRSIRSTTTRLCKSFFPQGVGLLNCTVALQHPPGLIQIPSNMLNEAMRHFCLFAVVLIVLLAHSMCVCVLHLIHCLVHRV